MTYSDPYSWWHFGKPHFFTLSQYLSKFAFVFPAIFFNTKSFIPIHSINASRLTLNLVKKLFELGKWHAVIKKKCSIIENLQESHKKRAHFQSQKFKGSLSTLRSSTKVLYIIIFKPNKCLLIYFSCFQHYVWFHLVNNLTQVIILNLSLSLGQTL